MAAAVASTTNVYVSDLVRYESVRGLVNVPWRVPSPRSSECSAPAAQT